MSFLMRYVFKDTHSTSKGKEYTAAFKSSLLLLIFYFFLLNLFICYQMKTKFYSIYFQR